MKEKKNIIVKENLAGPLSSFFINAHQGIFFYLFSLSWILIFIFTVRSCRGNKCTQILEKKLIQRSIFSVHHQKCPLKGTPPDPFCLQFNSTLISVGFFLPFLDKMVQLSSHYVFAYSFASWRI
jgi:hypothetical protein